MNNIILENPSNLPKNVLDKIKDFLTVSGYPDQKLVYYMVAFAYHNGCFNALSRIENPTPWGY